MSSCVYEVTPEDIKIVLRENAHKVANANGIPFDAMADVIFYDAFSDEDTERVERATQHCNAEEDARTKMVYAEIRTLLVEKGIIKA